MNQKDKTPHNRRKWLSHLSAARARVLSANREAVCRGLPTLTPFIPIRRKHPAYEYTISFFPCAFSENRKPLFGRTEYNKRSKGVTVGVRESKEAELDAPENERLANDARLVKHSVRIAGHATSISLEEIFWLELKILAREREKSLAALIAEIDAMRAGTNLSSALRVFVTQALKARA